MILINRTLLDLYYEKYHGISPSTRHLTDIQLSRITVHYLLGSVIILTSVIGYPFMRFGLLNLRKPNSVFIAYIYDMILAAIAFYIIGYAFSTSDITNINYEVIKNETLFNKTQNATTNDIIKYIATPLEGFIPSNTFITFNPANVIGENLEIRSIAFLRLIYHLTFSTIASTSTVGRLTLTASFFTRFLTMGFLLPVIFYWTHHTKGWLKNNFIYSDYSSAYMHLGSGMLSLIGCIFYGLRRSIFEELTENPPVYHTAILCLGTLSVFINIFITSIVDLYFNKCNLLDYLEIKNAAYIQNIFNTCSYAEFLEKVLNSTFKMSICTLSAIMTQLVLTHCRKTKMSEYEIYKQISVVTIGSLVAILPNLLTTSLLKCFLFGIVIVVVSVWWQNSIKAFKIRDQEQITFVHFACALLGIVSQPYMNSAYVYIKKNVITNMFWQFLSCLSVIGLCTLVILPLFVILYKINYLLIDLKHKDSKKYFTWYKLNYTDIKDVKAATPLMARVRQNAEGSLYRESLSDDLRSYRTRLSTKYRILSELFNNNTDLMNTIMFSNQKNCHFMHAEQIWATKMRHNHVKTEFLSLKNGMKHFESIQFKRLPIDDLLLLHQLNFEDPFLSQIDSKIQVGLLGSCTHFSDRIILQLKHKNFNVNVVSNLNVKKFSSERPFSKSANFDGYSPSMCNYAFFKPLQSSCNKLATDEIV